MKSLVARLHLQLVALGQPVLADSIKSRSTHLSMGDVGQLVSSCLGRRCICAFEKGCAITDTAMLGAGIVAKTAFVAPLLMAQS